MTDPDSSEQPPESAPALPALHPAVTRDAGLRHDVAGWLIAGAALAYVMAMHLLPALLGGLVVYELVHLLAPFIAVRRLGNSRAKAVVVALLGTLVIALISLAVLGAVAYFRRGGGDLPLLANKMAEIIEGYRTLAPDWLLHYLPEDADALKQAAAGWLRAHAGDLQVLGTQAGRTLGYLVIGMIIGAMVALQEAVPGDGARPLTRSIQSRARRLARAFRRVVFAQVRIAALNTFFTWCYLGVALPLFGVHLPFVKTLIAITFIAGLIPVIGNLISNTVILVVSVNQSLGVAASSLAYLVLIHKLEYFLNARIIGSQIRTRAWEILLSMLVMEVAYGIPGVIAAPIFYAYVKDELAGRGLI